MRSLLNRKIRTFGHVTALALDTGEHSINFRVALRGESEPVDVHINRYEIDHTASGPLLTIVDATTSRAWLTAALREFAIGHSWPIPSRVGVLPRLLT
jgi:hypothetical protein